MKATIFCDNSAFTAQARALLRRVGHRPGVNVRWRIKTWPVCALHQTNLSEKALQESAGDHLIIIPGRHARSLAPHLRVWLNCWAAQRQLEDAAVGVIEDDPDSSAANEVSLELRFLIGRHGLNLIHDKVNLHKGARLLLLAETQTTHQTWMLPPAVKTSLRTVDSSFQDRLRPEALYS